MLLIDNYLFIENKIRESLTDKENHIGKKKGINLSHR